MIESTTVAEMSPNGPPRSAIALLASRTRPLVDPAAVTWRSVTVASPACGAGRPALSVGRAGTGGRAPGVRRRPGPGPGGRGAPVPLPAGPLPVGSVIAISESFDVPPVTPLNTSAPSTATPAAPLIVTPPS